MELQHTKEFALSSDVALSFDLTSKLLTEMLIEYDKQLIITAKSEGFVYNSIKSLEVADPVNILITSADLTETGFKTEISISGVVKDQMDNSYSFTLYFIMKRNIHTIPGKMLHTKHLDGKYLVLPIMRQSRNLHDSLFNLALEGIDSSGDKYNFSQGRGYLMFHREVDQRQL